MTTMDHTELYEPDGHLTELALTCVADGELDLLPEGVLAHLDRCDDCSHRLGEAALLSVAAGEALHDVADAAPAVAPIAALARPADPQPVPATPAKMGGTPMPPRRARRPLPVAAIAAALILAMISAGPALLDAARGVPGTLAGVVNSIPFLFRVGAAFVRAPWGEGAAALIVRCATALVLVAIGLQVARVKSRSFQEGGV